MFISRVCFHLYCHIAEDLAPAPALDPAPTAAKRCAPSPAAALALAPTLAPLLLLLRLYTPPIQNRCSKKRGRCQKHFRESVLITKGCLVFSGSDSVSELRVTLRILTTRTRLLKGFYEGCR